MNEKINVSEVSLPYFQDLSEQFSVNTMTKRLRTEISAVLQSYTRGPLSNLNLLRQTDVGKYTKGIPIEIIDKATLKITPNGKECVIESQGRTFSSYQKFQNT